MEDISSLVWLAIAVIWFLSRLVRRGVKKAASSRKPETQRRPPRPAVSRQTPLESEASQRRFGDQQPFSGRGGTGPPPIVPR